MSLQYAYCYVVPKKIHIIIHRLQPLIQKLYGPEKRHI